MNYIIISKKMKSFHNKNAMTLVELIISIFISSTVIIIVMTFMTTTLNELRITNKTTQAIDSWFSLKDTINRYVKSGLDIFTIYWSNLENNLFILENWTWDTWILFWVVNYETKKIQKEKTYWDNFVWYRLLSATELWNIYSNSWVLYDYTFYEDKIFEWVRVKDFNAELYNSWLILDVYMSVLLVEDENNFGKNLSELFFDKNDVLEFNFDF